jgi:fucose 4-O-acetylase-like acetyltransferase
MTSATSRPGTAPPDATRPATQRDPWLDNAKFWLIALVVLGHTLTSMVGRLPAAHALYVWVYAFHMPAFVFLAGYVSRSRELTARRLQRLVTGLLAPYVIFTGVYAVATTLLTGRNQADLVDPYWLLWFLPALAAWRLTTPLLLNLRWPLAISVLVGLAAGASTRIGPDLTLSRILALAPFFVLGAVLPRDWMQLLRSHRAVLPGVAALVASLGCAAVLAPYVPHFPSWLFWNDAYETRGISLPVGLGLRAAMYVISTVMLLAALAVVPRSAGRLTALGAASMYTFLLHGLVVRLVQWAGYDDLVTSWPELLLTVVLCVPVAAALSSRPVRAVARPLVEPPLGWLLRPTSQK